MSQSPQPRHRFPRRAHRGVRSDTSWPFCNPDLEKIVFGGYIGSEEDVFGGSGEEVLQRERLLSSSSSPSTGASISPAKQQLQRTTRRITSTEEESEDDIISMAGKRTRRPENQGAGDGAASKRAKRGRATESVSDWDENDDAEAAAAQKASQLELHVRVMLEAISLDDSTMTVKVGLVDPRSFIAHAHLLALHSCLFARALEAFKVKQENIKQERGSADYVTIFYDAPLSEAISNTATSTVKLNDVVKSEFSAFFNWIYSGKLNLPSQGTDIQPFESVKGAALTNLWVLGSKLKAPGFQNFVMDELCSELAATGSSFLTTSQVRDIYSATASNEIEEKNCVLRNFTIHCISAYQPFQRHAGDAYAYGEWGNLFEELKGLSLEVLKAGGRGTGEAKMPWDEKMRSEYLVEEWPLQERWDEIKRCELHD